jgi:hypothetical protein
VKAAVIGRSVGGVLAAAALADRYKQVTVIDRDTLPEAGEPRGAGCRGRSSTGCSRTSTRVRAGRSCASTARLTIRRERHHACSRRCERVEELLVDHLRQVIAPADHWFGLTGKS